MSASDSRKNVIRNRDAEEDVDIWSAIRYLDPDLPAKGSNWAVIVGLLAVALLLCATWFSLQLRAL